MHVEKIIPVLTMAAALLGSACSGAAPPTATPTLPPTETAPPTATLTPTPTPTPTPGPCAGQWVGEWAQVQFQTNTGGIVLPVYAIAGKQLTLRDDCTYVEDWTKEASDIGCISSGLIQGDYSIDGTSIAFTAVDIVSEVDLDCGGGSQLAGSEATTPLNDIPPPSYSFDPAALPAELILHASYKSLEGHDITVNQRFEP